MLSHDLRNKTALVTGASSGLGLDFARQLAAIGCHLVLVARRRDRLEALASELRAAHGIDVLVVDMDLTERDAAQRLYDTVHARGVQVDVLVNNAGYGVHGEFITIPWERERDMLELDIVTLVHLTKLFVKDMVARDFGYVLQVSSIGAYQPSPTYASYAAAKAFVLSFGEALAYELRNTNVRCTVLSPGVTATEFLQVSGQAPTRYQRMMMMTSEAVVRRGLWAMLRGRASVIPGFFNWLGAQLVRLVPRRLATAMAYQSMR